MASEAAAMTWSHLPDCSSLLLRLLAHLWGAPPVLRSRGGAGAAPLVLSILVLSSSLCWGAEWCGLSLDQQVTHGDWGGGTCGEWAGKEDIGKEKSKRLESYYLSPVKNFIW